MLFEDWDMEEEKPSKSKGKSKDLLNLDNLEDEEEGFSEVEDNDWGTSFSEDGIEIETEYSTEVDYKTYENKVVRIFTKGIEHVTKGKREDLYGDICLVDKYDEENEYLDIEKLGKKEKMRIDKKFIDKLTGARLSEVTKDEIKSYRKYHREMVKAIRYILRSKQREKDLLGEISKLLYEIGSIAEETYEPLPDRDDPYGEYNTYGGLGGYGSYDNINQRGSGGFLSSLFGGNKSPDMGYGNRNHPYDNSYTNHFGNDNGYFGNSRSSSRSGHGMSSSYFGNQGYRSNRRLPEERNSVRNEEGMEVFQKDIFGNEKRIYERTKSGKKKKKPTVMMKAGRTYYVKLTNKEMLLVFVKSEYERDYRGKIIREEKYYYSEYGLVDAREIAWFREKENHERGTSKIKDNYRRVFTIERQLEKLHEKMEERDKLVKENERLKGISREKIHKLVVDEVRRGDVLYQSKSKITLGVIVENGIKYFIIKGVEGKGAKYLYNKYRKSVSKMVYKGNLKLYMIPLIRGVRYYELNELIEDCIKLYGNAEKRMVRLQKKLLLQKYMEKSNRMIDIENESEDY